jgi:hypothetical protein
MQTNSLPSAQVPDGTIKRTLAGVECACCGYDIKPDEPRVVTADGVHCSTSCANVDARRVAATSRIIARRSA